MWFPDRHTTPHLLGLSAACLILATGPTDVYRLTDVSLLDNPAAVLLNLTLMSSKRYCKSLLKHLLNAARACVPSMWKQQSLPTVLQWFARVNVFSRLNPWQLPSGIRQRSITHTGYTGTRFGSWMTIWPILPCMLYILNKVCVTWHLVQHRPSLHCESSVNLQCLQQSSPSFAHSYQTLKRTSKNKS